MVGLAAARALALAGRSVVVLERERAVGTAVSSRNSGVIHAGLYYSPGSLKAKPLCARQKSPVRILRPAGRASRTLRKADRGGRGVGGGVLEEYAARARANGAGEMSDCRPARWRDSSPRCVAWRRCIRRRRVLSMCTNSCTPMRRISNRTADTSCSAPGSTPRRCIAGGFRLDARRGTARLIHLPGTRQRRRSRGARRGRADRRTRAAHDTARPVRARALLLAAGRRAISADSFIRWRTPIASAFMRRSIWRGACVSVRTSSGSRASITASIRAARSSSPPQSADTIRRLEPARLEPDYTGIRPKIYAPDEPAPDFRIDGPAAHGVPGLVNLFGIESPGLTASLAIAEAVASYLVPRPGPPA